MHSTETAFLKVQDDVLSFDTIDHAFLPLRLWINSYLSDNIQIVNIKGTLLDTQELSFDVLQGSVLGPMLYCLYSKHVSNIIRPLMERNRLKLNDDKT